MPWLLPVIIEITQVVEVHVLLHDILYSPGTLT
jgi:hypothetical protein